MGQNRGGGFRVAAHHLLMCFLDAAVAAIAIEIEVLLLGVYK